MDSKLPSMTALLGLLAIAGYQNREKLAEMMRGQSGAVGTSGAAGQGAGSGSGSGSGSGLGGLLGGATGGAGAGASGLGGLLGGAGLGTLLSGGLGQLVEHFKNNGQGEVADSWVGRGPNKELAPPDLERAIGPDVLDDLTKHTGLSRADILNRLSRELPHAVDQYTPEGRIPSENEFRRT